ncbi:hypothetical protein [Bacillus sp. B1-b2]|uniref:hypothetical protein n=1 Tax=Bacillus sp. B1-b2 TaxID=2653201 RepID=UPI001262A015|nr:hypothetical protein [Bacillus sp. B1-b2]KAB7662728.1 hypothetical protein F9279_24640 [Bacillus sp. B1-b2]
MDKILSVNHVTYCCIWTLFITITLLIITGLSVYTIAAMLSGAIVAFINVLEDEVIHKRIYK